MNYLGLPFTLQDLPSPEEIERIAKALGIPVPVGALYAMVRLMRIANDMQEGLEQSLQPHGLSLGRFTLLMTLLREEGHRLKPSVLAERAGVTRATVTGLLDGLEARGVVRRTAHPEDRRSLLVELTPEGLNFVTGMLPDHTERVAKMMSSVDESDEADLLRILEKIETNLNALVEE